MTSKEALRALLATRDADAAVTIATNPLVAANILVALADMLFFAIKETSAVRSEHVDADVDHVIEEYVQACGRLGYVSDDKI